jgi:hypothetical protein
MANDTTGQPWIVDTKDVDIYARDATATVGNANTLSTAHKFWVDHLTIHTGAGTTDIEVKDTATGKRIAFIDAPAANDDIWYEVTAWVHGLHVTSAPASFEIEVWHGKQGEN